MLNTMIYLFSELEKVYHQIQSGEHHLISTYTEIQDKISLLLNQIISDNPDQFLDENILYTAFQLVYETTKVKATLPSA